MILLYADESNLEERSGDFLIYGGLTVPGANASELSSEIESIRADLGVPRDFVVKFNPGPENLDHEGFKELKQRVLSAAADHGCELLLYLVLHDLAKDGQEARRFGVNTLAYHFDCVLKREGDCGVMLIDRFTDRQIDGILRERFLEGVKGLPYSEEYRLEQIVGLHYSAVGQSHYTSIIDVAVGSFRFAVNAFTRDNRQLLGSAATLLAVLAPLARRTPAGKVSNLSLHFSPTRVLNAAYRARYEGLASFLKKNGWEPEQTIRSY